MKKRRIKTWVKVAFVVLIVLTIFAIDYKITNDAVKKCVNLGYDQNVCIKNL